MTNSNIQSDRETIYFIFSLIFSILIYVLAVVSIIGIAIALSLLALILFSNALMLGSIRGNGIRIHERQFPDVYENVQAMSKEMGLKNVPDVFVIQSEGALNAFATRFFGRNMVVLYSEVFELAREQGMDELNFIIAHELAHVKRRHVWKNILIMPAGFIPFLSQAYSRSCEYTCDRHAAYAIQNVAASKRALTLLGVGKQMYTEVNEDAYREQIATESNSFVWLSEVLSSHPRLPKRIQALEQFDKSGVPVYTQNHGKIALGATLIFGGLIGVYILTIALFTGGALAFSQLMPDTLEDSLYADPFAAEGETSLMTAASMGDQAEVERLIAEGADIQEKDSDGADALMFAVYAGDAAIASSLLEAGADPNTADNYSSALGNAVMYSEYDTAKLLVEKGADPTLAGPDGMAPMDLVGAATKAEFLEMVEAENY